MWIDGTKPIETPMIEMNCLEQVYVCLCCHLYTDIQLTFCFVLFLLFFVVVFVLFFLLEEEGGVRT